MNDIIKSYLETREIEDFLITLIDKEWENALSGFELIESVPGVGSVKVYDRVRIGLQNDYRAEVGDAKFDLNSQFGRIYVDAIHYSKEQRKRKQEVQENETKCQEVLTALRKVE